jgi:hypothetical protein
MLDTEPDVEADGAGGAAHPEESAGCALRDVNLLYCAGLRRRACGRTMKVVLETLLTVSAIARDLDSCFRSVRGRTAYTGDGT